MLPPDNPLRVERQLELWLKYTKGFAIPNELKFRNWQTHRYNGNNTPLMLWLVFRKGEPIPDDIFYDDWMTDVNDDGETPLIMLA